MILLAIPNPCPTFDNLAFQSKTRKCQLIVTSKERMPKHAQKGNQMHGDLNKKHKVFPSLAYMQTIKVAKRLSDLWSPQVYIHTNLDPHQRTTQTEMFVAKENACWVESWVSRHGNNTSFPIFSDTSEEVLPRLTKTKLWRREKQKVKTVSKRLKQYFI